MGWGWGPLAYLFIGICGGGDSQIALPGDACSSSHGVKCEEEAALAHLCYSATWRHDSGLAMWMSDCQTQTPAP